MHSISRLYFTLSLGLSQASAALIGKSIGMNAITEAKTYRMHSMVLAAGLSIF